MRLYIHNMYDNLGSNVPFKELIDDPTYTMMKRDRQRKLNEKARDIGEML